MGFDPYNCAMKIWESIWDSNSHNGNSFGSVRVHSLTLFALLGACDATPRPPFWHATLQALALVMSPRLGLQHITKRLKVCFNVYWFVSMMLSRFQLHP
jgi:hypothetical protein